MTHEDSGHYAAKHPRGTKLNPKIAEAVKREMRNGMITCVAAHKIAGDLNISPADVGMALDLLEVRIAKCQLGLFGYGPQKKVVKSVENIVPELDKAIRETLADNRVSCFSCWEIARQFGLARMDVSAACETLRIKISSCQLGSFGK